MNSQEINKSNSTMAYVDGYLYTREEIACSTCGNKTNRIKVENAERTCIGCDVSGN